MGRTVVGDENRVESQVDSIIQSGCSVQVGLLIGKWGRGGSRDLVFSLVPTPKKDGEEPATLGPEAKVPVKGNSRKGSKGKPVADSSPMHLSTDWICEHARQVSRMLLGGMEVVGVYVFSTEATFKSSLAVLWQTVRGVGAALEKKVGAEYHLLHVSSSPRRISCRSCSSGSSFSTTALHPVEWKLGKVLSNLQEFSCTYAVDMSRPVRIGANGASAGLMGDLSSAISCEAERLRAAFAVVDGALVQPEKLLGSGSTVHAVELLLPFNGGAGLQAAQSDGRMSGKVICKGEVHARAYGVVREPVSHAIADLQGDIIASLKARLGLLVDEAEQRADDANINVEEKNWSKLSTSDALLLGRSSRGDVPEQSFVIPRRVFVPWLQGAMISDYMLPGERLEDVQERVMELFGMEEEVAQSTILEPELLGSNPEKVLNSETKRKDVDQIGVDRSIPGQAEKGASSGPTSFYFVTAVIVLLIALLLALGLISR